MRRATQKKRTNTETLGQGISDIKHVSLGMSLRVRETGWSVANIKNQDKQENARERNSEIVWVREMNRKQE